MPSTNDQPAAAALDPRRPPSRPPQDRRVVQARGARGAGRVSRLAGQEEHRMSGETYHAFAIREADTGKMFGVTEHAALRFLRQVRSRPRVSSTSGPSARKISATAAACGSSRPTPRTSTTPAPPVPTPPAGPATASLLRSSNQTPPVPAAIRFRSERPLPLTRTSTSGELC
jgi:hypothetical protein